jgi:hypothetical protein
MAKSKKIPKLSNDGYKQSGELVNQHKRFAMGENILQGKVPEKKK